MTARTPISARRRSRSRGQALVEGALVMLPLMALITGFIDVNLAVFQWSVMQNAVREGARYAVTYQTSVGLGQDASIEQVVSHFSMGMLPLGSPYIKVNYFSQKALSLPIPAPAGNSPGNIVEVSIQNYPMHWLVPIAGTIASPFRSNSPATLNIYSDDVMGGYPLGVNTVAR